MLERLISQSSKSSLKPLKGRDSVKYPFTVTFHENEGHKYWVASSSALKGCVGQGETAEEATAELSFNETEWLETAEEVGIPIPPVPTMCFDGYSGKLTIRIEPIEHGKAVCYAREQGVSLNKYINDAIVSKNSECAHTLTL